MRFSAFFFGLAASVPLLAHADGASDTDLRSFRASTDKHGTLATEGVATPGPWNLQAAHWLVFESASLRVTETNGDVRRALGPRVLGEPTISLGLGHRAALGVSLPYVFHQSTGSSSLAAAPPSTGIGDVALHGKASVKEIDADAGGLGFAFLTRVQLPTGDRTSFISDKGAIADLRALIAVDYILARITGVIGYRMRFVHHQVSDVTLGDTIPWGATLSLKPVPGWGLDTKKWLFNLETHGEVGAVPNKLLKTSRVSPAFLGLSIRSELAKDLYLFGGVEMGLTDAIGAPLFRGMLTLSYAPTIVDDDRDGVPDDGTDECPGLPEDGQGKNPHDGCPDYAGEETSAISPGETEATPLVPPEVVPVASSDADADGIPDEADKCPNERETVNGYEDEDGCPELDKDNDTFLDAVDSCPDKPETFNGVNDDDGCPDEAPKALPLLIIANEANGSVALGRNIKFDGPAPTKDAASDLRALAAWLINHPGTRLRVAVRPDGKGEAADKLATTRAISIVEALVRYAHAGGVAEAVAWDPKSKAATNVALTPVALPKTP